MTWKKGKYVAANKFSVQNIAYYVQYVVGILLFSAFNLKFVDEASFEDRDLRRQHGYAQSGRRLSVVAPRPPAPRAFTCFALTDLRHPNGFVRSPFNRETNTALHFLHFVVSCLGRGHIRGGDVLVLDNASIHSGQGVRRAVVTIFDFLGVRLIYLPTYSPELNPVELLWALVKREMRLHRRDTDTFENALRRAFRTVTLADVAGWYQHCLYNFR